MEQFKSFLVRGSIEPPKDCLLVDDELLPIQPAKPIPKGKYSVSYFSGKVSKDDRRNKSNIKVPTTVPKGQGATQLQVFEGPNPKRRKSVRLSVAVIMMVSWKVSYLGERHW